MVGPGGVRRRVPTARARRPLRPDELLRFDGLAERPEARPRDELLASMVAPDADAVYDGGVHAIDLSAMRPMVAHPGDPDRGIPSDPTNGAFVDELGRVSVDIA